MTIQLQRFAIALLAVCGAACHADELPDFFVAPIATELQRATVSSTAGTYAVVNCNALIANGDIDLSNFDEDGFVASLSNWKRGEGQLRLVCRYKLPADIKTERRKQLHQHLKDLGSTAGYRKVKVSETRTSAAWKDAYQRAFAFRESGNAEEPLIENEHVRVFPVRTKLSKFVHGNVDCMVEIFHPIDGRTKGISAALEASIRDAVEQTQLGEKHTMMFRLSSTAAGRDMVEELFDSRSAPTIPKTESPELLKIFRALEAEYEPSPALVLAQDLGFQKITYSHSPGGGAPETLVGAEAPNFKLARLTGDQLDLHEFMDGRPALITFWGLACGPCREEAPHLSAFHEKYGERFSIVAVNGYNDKREAVNRYATSEGLTHPIVLQGKSVSDDLYHVGAYPTTFWVDHHGTVIDYEVGFASSGRLEDRIKSMLPTP